MAPSAVVDKLKKHGIQWFAITDLAVGNCPAMIRWRRKRAFFYGVEIQSMEEIHLLAT